jgi:hypothetical protein
MMKILPLILIVSLSLAGCSRHHKELEISKKTRLVSELIDSAPRCEAYVKQLNSGQIDDDGVDDIYRAAQKAHCIKKDI